MSPSSQSLYEEGLVLPRVLLHEAGKPNQAVYDIIRANVRSPEDVLGDIEGQVSGCWAAERGLMRMAERHGVATVRDYGGHLIDYTERLMREAIASIPDGVYAVETFIEDDGIGGPGVNLVLSVKVKGGSITLDFTGTDPQTRSAINVPTATVAANCMGNFHLLFGLHDIPSNAGIMAPFTFILPEGTVLNPHFPAAVGSRSTVTNRLEETFFKAIALAMPERVPATSAVYNIMIYTPDGAGGEHRELLFDLWGGSRGGRPTMDAADGPRPANSGRVGAEVLEQDFPLTLMGYGFVPDTGGAGRFRGGLALFRRWRFDKPGRVFNRNLRVTPVPGVAGGKAGNLPRVLFFSGDQVTDYSEAATIDIHVQPGVELLAVFPGPGGHGDPLARDFAKINEDVFQEKLSREFAEREYSVCIDPVSLKVDEVRTAELRRSLRDPAPSA
jgi:N-methylhydantoinase B